MESVSSLLENKSYIPRGQNELPTIFKNHFQDFLLKYGVEYENDYGIYRYERVTKAAESFIGCGDYSLGIARVLCTNPSCRHDYFVPFSCKSFYLCPSCHQKKVLLLSEQLVNEILLKLPHRQFVYTFPKVLRQFFKKNSMLFSDMMRLVFTMMQDFYHEVSGKKIRTAAIISYQSFGDSNRFNPHLHAIVMEGGYDEEGNFVYIPLSNTAFMTELFRKLVIKALVEKKLINEQFGRNLLSWKNSGFSIDNSVRIYGNDDKTKEALIQYISRAPVSLSQLVYEPSKGKVLYHTKYNPYFGENLKVQDAVDFIYDLLLHVPPKGKQYIRRYGWYSSRSRGKWEEQEYLTRLAPEGWKEKHAEKEEPRDSNADSSWQEHPGSSVTGKQKASSWARLIAKVYKTDPLVCPRCGSDMKIVAVITDTSEVRKILQHLSRTGRAPPKEW